MPPIPYPGHIVKSGDSDKQLVSSIQHQLNELRCSEPALRVDGDFGNKTTRAVKVFQSRAVDIRQIPLKTDGQIGSITWAALFGGAPPLTQSASLLLQKAIDVAISQAGVTENPLFSNDGPQVRQYLANVNLGPGVAWCAAFLHWCFDRAASELGRANPVVKTGGVMEHWVRAGKSGIPRILAAQAKGDPTLINPGQIFIISFGDGTGHTGLITAVENGIIETIEGNAKPAGGIIHDGYGVFRRSRKIVDIKPGYIDYKQS